MNIRAEISVLRKRFELAHARVLARLSEDRAEQLKEAEFRLDKAISSRADFPELLARLDRGQPVKRIFVMGCGRSGTWLLTSLLSTVKGAYLIFEEVDVGRFARIKSDQRVHILKRHWKSYSRVDSIAPYIGVIWIVRHPFDVVTSYNPGKGKAHFHIGPARWNAEMNALKAFVDRPRENAMVIRYEDLTTEPAGTLDQIAETFGFEFSSHAHDFGQHVAVPSEVAVTMHGVRSISPSSIGRWRVDPERRRRVAEIAPMMGENLRWVAERFDYDLSFT
jgi:hypothetical protein